MLRFFERVNSGSAKQRRDKKAKYLHAQQCNFNALQDAEESKTGKALADTAKKKLALTASRTEQRSSQEQKALDLLDCRDRMMRRRAKEDRQLIDAETLVVNLRPDAALIVVDDDVTENPPLKKQKGWTSRPKHWVDIVEDYEERKSRSHGSWQTAVTGTMEFYDQELGGASVGQNYQKLLRWCREKDTSKALFKPGNLPVYGREVDEATYRSIVSRNCKGLGMDPFVMRQLLVTQLALRGMGNLLTENGGKYHFGGSWAARFMKRWKLRRRVATTKMREKPADFEAKVEEYIRIGAAVIKHHNIPRALVIGCDETGCVFVPKSKYTVALKGAKRIRLLGVGKDKEQFTVTIFCTEEGNILDAQMIFGGKTAQCHPGGKDARPPAGIFWAHSESHWQTPDLFAVAIENIVVPYKTAKIAELGLPADQVCMLKLDLHYSHKINPTKETDGSRRLKATLERHHIIPFYVPGACTDEVQECDTVLNKPFKGGVKDAFRNYLHSQFDEWVESGKDPDEWVPLFTLSVLKPRVTAWVQQGLAKISTPEMKIKLAHAFETDGRFKEIRSAACQHAAGMEELVQSLEFQLQIEEEPEDIEEIAAVGDGELVAEAFVEPDPEADAAALDAAPAHLN
jgi:hypothetical protein